MSLLSTLRNREAHKLHYTPPHTHTYMYTHTHTHTYMYNHTYTDTHTLIYTCTHTHTLSHTLTLTCTCTHTHTYIHSHTHSHTLTLIHTHSHTYTLTLTYTLSHIHTLTYPWERARGYCDYSQHLNLKHSGSMLGSNPALDFSFLVCNFLSLIFLWSVVLDMLHSSHPGCCSSLWLKAFLI